MIHQALRLQLEGMTAGDYLAHLRDPEPASFDAGLRSVEVEADPLGAVVEALLTWDAAPADPCMAARLAGFPSPAEVVAMDCRVLHSLDGCERRAA
jgi:hypothetical protein